MHERKLTPLAKDTLFSIPVPSEAIVPFIPSTPSPCKQLQHLVEGGNQRLGEPEREHELGARHEKLRCQALEEASHALVLDHLGDDSEPALGVLEVPILDSGLDDVEGCGYKKRGRGTGDRGNKVLTPGCGVVVGQFVVVLLRDSRSSK